MLKAAGLSSLCRKNKDVGTEEKPLFVLRYVKYKRRLRMIFCFVFGFIGLQTAWLIPLSLWFGKIVFTTVGLFLAWMFAEYFFFREVRLYADRIVGITKVGARCVILEKASLAGGGGGFARVMRLSRRDRGWFSNMVYGVFYDELAADMNDVNRLNGLLSELSGRDIDELRAGQVRIAKLFERE